jgi:iron(III) transport system substrate-binding protein
MLVKLVVSVIIFALSLHFHRDATGANIADIALYHGSDRQSKLEEGVKREGEFVWYTSVAMNDSQRVLQLFERRYPFIRTKLIRFASERLIQRYQSEFQANRSVADVIDTDNFAIEFLRRKKMLQSYYTPLAEKLDKRFVQPQGYWVENRLIMIVVGYNTRLVKSAERPKRYEDLLDPKWKDNIALEQEQTEWFLALMEHWGEEKGKAFFKKLATQNAKIRSGHTLLAQLISAGEDYLSPNAYSHQIAADQRKGAPLDWVNLEPVIAKSAGGALARNAAHPHAALLFLDFMISKEGGQKVFREASRIPTHPEVLPDPLSLRQGFEFIVVDPTKYLDKIDYYSNLWRKWMLR